MHFEIFRGKMTPFLKFVLKYSGKNGGEEWMDEISKQNVDVC